MNLEKYIEISLCISGLNLPVNAISDRLALSASSVRTQYSIPKSVPDEYKCNEWCFTIRKSPCTRLSSAFDDLISVFSLKKGDILAIRDMYKADISIVIVTDMVNDELPELVIPLSAISFSNDIKAEINFDIYSY